MKRFRVLEISFREYSQLESEMNEKIGLSDKIINFDIVKGVDMIHPNLARIILESLPD
ncbi:MULTISPECIES: hypothetical protein [unclassified Myroides]|uniref:hypothetical protein n=1 Tax=unclassified Myroides TaxID=2642485 RepID=UPI003D2F7056